MSGTSSVAGGSAKGSLNRTGAGAGVVRVGEETLRWSEFWRDQDLYLEKNSLGLLLTLVEESSSSGNLHP